MSSVSKDTYVSLIEFLMELKRFVKEQNDN